MKHGKERGHQTQWAAQFAVASELCKRGYEGACNSGHTTPVADLMVVSPETKEMFLVDVKGLYRKNPLAHYAKTSKAKSVLYTCLCSTGRTEPIFRDDAATGEGSLSRTN